uniref:Uncharacterized protein n=1 Tax=Anopheles melas TaxID=34690 RepID=A0A182TZ26_9DIPT
MLTVYSVSGRASNASASCGLQHRYVSSFEPYVQSDGFAQSVLAAGTGATLSGLVRPPPALSVLSTSSNCSSSTTTTAGGGHYQQHQGLMEQQQHHHQHHLHNHISNQHHSPAPGSQNHAQLPQQQFDDATTSLSECGGHDGTTELRSLPSMPDAFSFTGRPFADSGNSSERPNLPVEHQPKGQNVQLPQLSAGHTNSTVAATVPAAITTSISSSSSSSSSRRVDSGGDGISCASSRTTSLSSASTAMEPQLSVYRSTDFMIVLPPHPPAPRVQAKARTLKRVF